ncbi:unnamed protein product [Plutella xylostella]|uniref:(diamondback moth) hypothetical protein n=1 Tax=Plutella xylostella TaxID=51655 RepID=A0A8S4GC81_PLUXY|nr:unnamed protein product [Plutella xylostella]
MAAKVFLIICVVAVLIAVSCGQNETTDSTTKCSGFGAPCNTTEECCRRFKCQPQLLFPTSTTRNVCMIAF